MTSRKSNLSLALFGILLAAAASVVDALEMVGGNLCNTGDFAVLTQEIVESRDATIFQGQDNIASGQDKFMVGTTKNGIRRGLIAFDFKKDDFPPDAKVECAEIRLHVAQTDASSVQVPEIKLHRITKSWDTTGSHRLTGVNGGTASDGDVTWGYANYAKSLWNKKGGDFDEKVVATKVDAGPIHLFGNTLGMTRLVQDWIEVDVNPFNAGFMVVGEENSSNEKYVHYDGIENAPELIPRLIVTYTSPSQGKEHREYTAYTSEDGSGPSSTPSNNDNSNVIAGVLLFVGGSVFGVLMAAFIICLRKRKRKKFVPDPTSQDVTEEEVEVETAEFA